MCNMPFVANQSGKCEEPMFNGCQMIQTTSSDIKYCAACASQQFYFAFATEAINGEETLRSQVCRHRDKKDDEPKKSKVVVVGLFMGVLVLVFFLN